jgi:hypothetical protein
MYSEVEQSKRSLRNSNTQRRSQIKSTVTASIEEKIGDSTINRNVECTTLFPIAQKVKKSENDMTLRRCTGESCRRYVVANGADEFCVIPG